MKNIPLALSYDDVLLVPQYSNIESRSEVDLTAKLSSKVSLKIPLISTKMDTVTGVDMAIAMGKLGGLGILPRFDSPEVQADKVKTIARSGVLTAAAVGVKEGYLERAEMLVKAGATVIDVDVAHGHMEKSLEATRVLKRHFGDKILLISGITATYDAADDLYSAGADSILVGIGSGSICTTRIQTGFGVPGFTSLLETAKAAKKHKKTFMPDGGTRNSGDIVKSLATGASAIIGGYIFSGTDKTPGEIISIDSKKYKQYNGSASRAEKMRQVKSYGEDKNAQYTKQVEGVESLVPYKGKLEDVVENLLAGIRSGLSYAGARNIPELWQKAEFIQITTGGLRESGAHDVLVTPSE